MTTGCDIGVSSVHVGWLLFALGAASIFNLMIHILHRACEVWSCMVVSFSFLNGLELKNGGIRVEIPSRPSFGGKKGIDDDVVHA